MSKIWRLRDVKPVPCSVVVEYNDLGKVLTQSPNVVCVCDPDWGKLLAASVDLPDLIYTGDDHWAAFLVPNVDMIYLCSDVDDIDEFLFVAVMRGVSVYTDNESIDSRVMRLAEHYGVQIGKLGNADSGGRDSNL